MCGLKLNIVHTVFSNLLSHPSWVCGLKQLTKDRTELQDGSHPSWVCGLKLAILCASEDLDVTPFVGVWIETDHVDDSSLQQYVTPFVGVWIETATVAR